MLEDRWRACVATHANEIALHETASGRSWTFRQLADEADSEPARPVTSDPILFPSGNGVGFLLTLLRAWRVGRTVCPLESGQAAPDFPPPPGSIVHLKMTSGTTGRPRCIGFTASQLAADADAIVSTMGLSPAFPNLGVISLAHSYGFSNLVLPLLLHGIPLILAPSPLPAMVQSSARVMGSTRITLPAVPALWRSWFEAAAIPDTVGVAISAGAPLPLGLETSVFREHGLRIHNFLGASECGGIAYDGSPNPRTDPRFVGTALNGIRLGRSADGCLEVRSPAVGEGYWPEPEPQLADGTYRSSDLVELGPDGSLLLLGRADDRIHVAGRKITPESIEAVLQSHPRVKECIVFGIPGGEQRGESIVAVIESEGAIDADSLRTFALGQLPAWQVPRVWRFLDSLPGNARGKRSRAQWRQHLFPESGGRRS